MQRRPLVASVLILATAAVVETSSRAAPNPPIPPGLLGGNPTSLNPQPKLPTGGTTTSPTDKTPDGLTWTPGAAAAEWTVLVYTVADNDLEGALLDDLDEMECIGSTPQVNIVMEIDRWKPDP